MSATGVCVRVERVNYCNTYKKCPQRGGVCVCVRVERVYLSIRLLILTLEYGRYSY